MRWIVSSGKDIYVDKSQLQARHNYIRQVTSAEVTEWKILQIKGSNKQFLYCISDDGLNGTFITAHIGEVRLICSLYEVASGDIAQINAVEVSLCDGKATEIKRINFNVDISNKKEIESEKSIE